jgi:SAM-dependent methyltransferase
MSTLRTWWWRQQFDPGLAGIVCTPFYFARRGLAAALRPRLGELRGEVLDVGCGRKPYEGWTRATRYVGVDVDDAVTRALGRADVFYDGRTLPFAEASFDAVICSQVLEHVFEPEAFLRELRRVVRPGGQLVLTVPFVWDEHEQPVDFARYSSFGLRALLERTGWTVETLEKTAPDLRTPVQLLAGWIFKVTRTRLRLLNLAVQLLLIAPVNVLGAVLAAGLPGNPDLYLDNVVVARRAGRP